MPGAATKRRGDAADPSAKGTPDDQFPVVGVGASAGGLEALIELLKHLPSDTGLGFVLIQHLDSKHESALPQLLARATSMPGYQVTHNVRLRANQVYVIPPGNSLVVEKYLLKLHPLPEARGAPHPIDTFFQSLALNRHDRSAGVVLSGTGNDGTLGLEAIKAEGGITFAQDDSARTVPCRIAR
jgi:two-component system, chemotaxis family, CheB/CheR fusion protein